MCHAFGYGIHTLPHLFILQSSMTINQALIVLHTTPSIFGKLLVHNRKVVWKLEGRASYNSSLSVTLILASQEVLK